VAVVTGDVWYRRGISLLWNPDSLSHIAKANEVHSVRDLLIYYKKGWPEDLPSASSNAIVVAGLDTVMDSMEPEEAMVWLEQTFYSALLSFQDEYQGQAALILWLSDGQKRLIYNMTDGVYYWKCAGFYRDHTIPLSLCLWNGAAKDVRLIGLEQSINSFDDKRCLGLYHPRIS